MNVTFLPRYKQVAIEEPCILMEVMIKHQVLMDFVCGGNGTCGKCKVLISKGNCMPYANAELQYLSKEELEAGYRLACEYRVTEDTCVILEEEIEPVLQNTPKITAELEDAEINIAFDIGTTTIEAAFLKNINHKQELVTKKTHVNPQRIHGLDVMSRLSYGIQSVEHAEVLQRLVLDALNAMITEFSTQYSVKKAHFKKIVVMGNTTMIYLLLNSVEYPIKSLVKPPFQVHFSGFIGNAKKYGFFVNETCQLIVPPLIQGYVGSDTLGCILATGIADKKGTYAIMDIGTNGEMVLSCDGRIRVCSTAAGPAFEGASIAQGMRAEKGAIYAVSLFEHELDHELKRKFDIRVIGDGQPRGICGSGLLDVISVFLELGWIDETGLMKERKIALDEEGKVSLWQEDVRQFQLAKAAIQAGFSLLLEANGVSLEQLDKIYIAGAFGSGLNVEHAKRCGLFPDVETDKFEYIENGSLTGGILILQNEECMKRSREQVQRMEHLELANLDEFRERFIQDMNLKH